MFVTVETPTSLIEERLAKIYTGDGFGGDNSMRAKVIRELVDEIRRLRAELSRQTQPPGGGRQADSALG